MSIAQLDEVKVKIRQFEKKLQSNPNDLDTIRILAQLEATKASLEGIVNPEPEIVELVEEPEIAEVVAEVAAGVGAAFVDAIEPKIETKPSGTKNTPKKGK